MRPPQDPATIAKAKEQDWYIEFDDINAKARNVLEKYSGIAPADVVPRVKEIRERAIAIFVYPCIGMLKFLDIEINNAPCYHEVKQRITAGEKYLELGCCFGQELRQPTIDGVPSSNLYATDLDLSFAELGYELFRDKDRLQAHFLAADILQASSPLDALDGQFGMINAQYFFHLFSWEQQLTIGKRMVRLLSKDQRGLITGGHVAGEECEQTNWLDSYLYVHSEASFRKLWEEIGAATGTKWEVDVSEHPTAQTITLPSGRRYHVMRYVCRQL